MYSKKNASEVIGGPLGDTVRCGCRHDMATRNRNTKRGGRGVWDSETEGERLAGRARSRSTAANGRAMAMGLFPRAGVQIGFSVIADWDSKFILCGHARLRRLACLLDWQDGKEGREDVPLAVVCVCVRVRVREERGCAVFVRSSIARPRGESRRRKGRLLMWCTVRYVPVYRCAMLWNPFASFPALAHAHAHAHALALAQTGTPFGPSCHRHLA